MTILNAVVRFNLEVKKPVKTYKLICFQRKCSQMVLQEGKSIKRSYSTHAKQTLVPIFARIRQLVENPRSVKRHFYALQECKVFQNFDEKNLSIKNYRLELEDNDIKNRAGFYINN